MKAIANTGTIVYNITAKVDVSIAVEWEQWQKNEHIPEIMATGNFFAYNFCKLLEQSDEEGTTYTVQFFATSLKQYETYIAEYAATLREKSFAKWGNAFVAFRTLMQVVN